MSTTNPDKPDNFSFLQCAKDFHESKEIYKLPQSTSKQPVICGVFLYEFTCYEESFIHSWKMGKKTNKERIKTITYFLLLNAAIEGEI